VLHLLALERLPRKYGFAPPDLQRVFGLGQILGHVRRREHDGCCLIDLVNHAFCDRLLDALFATETPCPKKRSSTCSSTTRPPRRS
jgi:hypothetical protein